MHLEEVRMRKMILGNRSLLSMWRVMRVRPRNHSGAVAPEWGDTPQMTQEERDAREEGHINALLAEVEHTESGMPAAISSIPPYRGA